MSDLEAVYDRSHASVAVVADAKLLICALEGRIEIATELLERLDEIQGDPETCRRNMASPSALASMRCECANLLSIIPWVWPSTKKYVEGPLFSDTVIFKDLCAKIQSAIPKGLLFCREKKSLSETLRNLEPSIPQDIQDLDSESWAGEHLAPLRIYLPRRMQWSESGKRMLPLKQLVHWIKLLVVAMEGRLARDAAQFHTFH